MKSYEFTNEQICNIVMSLEYLIHSGINVADALVLLSDDCEDPKIKSILSKMAFSADGGAPLSQVISESGAFPNYVAALTKVGEQSGRIEQSLHYIAAYYQERSKLNSQLRLSLLYPIALLAVLISVVVVLLIWVLPIFNDVYAQLGSGLTGFAGILLSIGKLLQKSLPIILTIVVLIMSSVLVMPIRRKLQSLFNNIFGDKGAGRKVLSARFVSAVSMGIGSGMTYREALSLACKLSEGENVSFKKRCLSCLETLEKTDDLSVSLMQNGFITVADRRLLDAGRRSGKEETVLSDLSVRLNERGQDALRQRAGLVEPIVVVIACLLIATVLLSVMLPLINIMNTIG